MSSKTYKAIFVPQELHKGIKIDALHSNMSMIEYLTFLKSLNSPFKVSKSKIKKYA